MSTVARQLISVQSCTWIVTEVAPSTLPPERLKTGLEAPHDLLTLSLVGDDRVDEELQSIRESEPGAEATEGDGGNRLGLPQVPPTSSGGQARAPSAHNGYF